MKRVLAVTIFAAILMSMAALGVVAQDKPSVELHGYVQNRLYANPDASPVFAVERLSLSAKALLAGDRVAYAEVYYHPWVPDDVFGAPGAQFTAEQGRVYLESAYVDMPLVGGRLRLGKGRQLNFGLTPAYPNRKTTQYGILSETFTQDRITGAQWSRKFNGFDMGVSVFNDPRIGNRKVGGYPRVEANKVVPHFAERDNDANLTGHLAVSGRLGVTKENFQIHGSYAVGELVQEDATFIANQFGVATTNTDHDKYGVDTTFSFGPYVAQGEWYQGNFSFLEITGYSVLFGYQPGADRPRTYVRWAELENDGPTLANPYTWDLQQLTFAYAIPISRGVWAELQYEKNMEDPPVGVADVDNDLLFVEFFTGF